MPGRSVNPLSARGRGGADYAHHITTGTPGFSDFPIMPKLVPKMGIA